jgi:6-phosphogluconate dehydrogenase (decarboxylating)
MEVGMIGLGRMGANMVGRLLRAGHRILRHAGVGKQRHERDAETTPLREPEWYRYDFDLADISEVWRRGSMPDVHEIRRSMA